MRASTRHTLNISCEGGGEEGGRKEGRREEGGRGGEEEGCSVWFPKWM